MSPELTYGQLDRQSSRAHLIPGLVRAAEPGFLLFVLGLGVIVAAAGGHGLRGAVTSLLPGGGSLPDLLAIAAVSALLANLVNNLPPGWAC